MSTYSVPESNPDPEANNALSPSAPAAPPEESKGPLISNALVQAEALSEAEAAEKMACEMVIEMGWSTFVEVGLALARIRDARLYRIEFDTFETYCRERW